jgi:hypothetical protein
MSLDWQADKTKIDPEFADDISKLLGASNFDWVVYRGWASSRTQEELYKRYLGGGPLAAKPGHSAHECNDSKGYPASLAVDLARIDSKGVLHWDYGEHSGWLWLWQACYEHPRLHSGHRFPVDTGGHVPADNDHVQAVKWQTYRAKLMLDGKW